MARELVRILASCSVLVACGSRSTLHAPVAQFAPEEGTNFRAVTHSKGMRVLYRVGWDTGIRSARVNVADGSVEPEPPVVAAGTSLFDMFAGTALGSETAVVWGRNPLSAPEVVVSILGEDGNKLAESSFPVSNYGNLAAIGSPNGDSLLVARDTFDELGTGSIGLTRFDCVE